METDNLLKSLEYWHIGVGIVIAIGVVSSMITRSLSKKFDSLAHSIFDRMDKQESRLETHICSLAETHVRIIDRIAKMEGQMAVQNMMTQMREEWSNPRHPRHEDAPR
jgi:hypothetical protein